MSTKREYIVEFLTACGCYRTEKMRFVGAPPDRLTRVLRIPFNTMVFQTLSLDERDLRYIERSFKLTGQQGPTLVYEEEFVK